MSSARRSPGTGSVFQRASDGKWIAQLEVGWSRKGTRRRRVRVAKSEPEARRLMREMLREAQAAEAPTTGGRPTVKTWADQWLDITQRTVRPTTWQSNRSQVSTWVVPTIGHRRLDRLTPADVRAVERAMEVAGRRPSTVSRCRAVLDKMLKDAIVEGHAVPQAVTMVDGVTAGESDRDAIPLPDAVALLRAAATLPHGSRWAAALLQGMRPAECLGLTWARVDLEHGELDVSWQLKPLPYVTARDRSSGFRVPRGYEARQVDGALHLVRPKTASGQRIIPLVPWMQAALTAWRDQCPPSRAGLVWPDPDGTPRDDKQDRAEWVALQDAAQVAHVEGDVGRRFARYECRHTTATLLREAGVDDETITAIMGHASILSTKKYLHTDRRRVRAALEGVAGVLELG